MHRLMSAGIWVPFVILSIAVGAACWFQWVLTASDPTSAPVEVREADRMTLLVGDEYPRLHLLKRSRGPKKPVTGPAPEPGPKSAPNDQPEPLGSEPLSSESQDGKRYEPLGKRDSIYALCRRLGIATPLNEILELNGWTEADARRLRPGTLVRLQ